ncbi:hypothetical protein BaRGS_00027566 [Batillaria attramentaria]|uniref:Uncharacterized protein n=1 Tax=Batillaria attramentaria TaxID=370345 RepID=A0ABD0K365_9CAEN
MQRKILSKVDKLAAVHCHLCMLNIKATPRTSIHFFFQSYMVLQGLAVSALQPDAFAEIHISAPKKEKKLDGITHLKCIPSETHHGRDLPYNSVYLEELALLLAELPEVDVCLGCDVADVYSGSVSGGGMRHTVNRSTVKSRRFRERLRQDAQRLQEYKKKRRIYDQRYKAKKRQTTMK